MIQRKTSERSGDRIISVVLIITTTTALCGSVGFRKKSLIELQCTSTIINIKASTGFIIQSIIERLGKCYSTPKKSHQFVHNCQWTFVHIPLVSVHKPSQTRKNWVESSWWYLGKKRGMVCFHGCMAQSMFHWTLFLASKQILPWPASTDNKREMTLSRLPFFNSTSIQSH
jgi:hypothetical protein